MTRFSLSSSLLLALSACVVGTNLDNTPGSTSDPGTGTTADPTEGPASLCPDSPNFSCTVPFNCTDFPCGGLQDRFDADGCPRPSCSADEPCPAGQVCYQTGAWGECSASGLSCEDEGDVCRCDQSLDCQDVSYCVPEDLGPPTDCNAITDAQACVAAGCSEAATSVPVSFENDGCVCGAALAVCLWFAEDEVGSTASPAPFYRKSTGEVVMFPVEWSDAPHGWASCANDPAAPPACACADACAI